MITTKTLSAFIFSGLFMGLTVSATHAQDAKPEDPALKIYRATPATLPLRQGMGHFKTPLLSNRQPQA
jgi:hypothetical protein